MIACLLISSSMTAQSNRNDEAKLLLNDFFAKEISQGNLYYNLLLDHNTIDRIVLSLEQRNTDSVYAGTDGKRVVWIFTLEEKEMIRKNFREEKGKAWDRGVLKNSFVYKSSKMPENPTMEDRIRFMEQQGTKNVVSFSHPIFLRGNSIALFFYGIYYQPAGGGGGEFVIFKKKNDKWEKHLVKAIFYN